MKIDQTCSKGDWYQHKRQFKTYAFNGVSTSFCLIIRSVLLLNSHHHFVLAFEPIKLILMSNYLSTKNKHFLKYSWYFWYNLIWLLKNFKNFTRSLLKFSIIIYRFYSFSKSALLFPTFNGFFFFFEKILYLPSSKNCIRARRIYDVST